MSLTDQAKSVTGLLTTLSKIPTDRLAIFVMSAIIIGGGWYTLHYAIPAHIRVMNTDLNAAVKAFERHTELDNKRIDKLIELIERRLDNDDRNLAHRP